MGQSNDGFVIIRRFVINRCYLLVSGSVRVRVRVRVSVSVTARARVSARVTVQFYVSRKSNNSEL